MGPSVVASPRNHRKQNTGGSGVLSIMKNLLFVFCLLCLSAARVQSKPQITRLFPVQEEMKGPQPRGNNETKPLDRLLGKLRATYDFVFRKPENTSSVEKILAKDAPDPDVQALRLIWSNEMRENSGNNEATKKPQPQRTYLAANEDWTNHIQPIDRLEPLESLELEEEEEEIDKNREVEFVTPKNNFNFPASISRHLVEWLGSLLGITYGVYSKLARAIYSNSTAIRIN